MTRVSSKEPPSLGARLKAMVGVARTGESVSRRLPPSAFLATRMAPLRKPYSRSRNNQLLLDISRYYELLAGHRRPELVGGTSPPRVPHVLLAAPTKVVCPFWPWGRLSPAEPRARGACARGCGYVVPVGC